MHQEQNIVKSIMSMCLDVTGFTKDNVNARKDLATQCDRPSMEAKPNARGKLRRPKAPYYLKPIKRKEELRYLGGLRQKGKERKEVLRYSRGVGGSRGAGDSGGGGG
jgi:hypothetical protein